MHASPLKDPKRLIRGQTVNLTPLFGWWTNHEGARPLTAWVHVTGSIVGTNAWGWVVEAQVESTSQPGKAEVTPTVKGQSKILLRNPPLQDAAEFESLAAQLKALNEQHAKLAGAEQRARNDLQTSARVQADYRRQGIRDRSVSRENRVDKQVETQAKAELRPLDRQIQDVKARLTAYPSGEQYSVDCFALETGQAYGGMAMFDHGVGLR